MKKYVFIILMIFMSLLNAEDKILKAITLDWEPHISPNLPNNGYFYEIAERIFSKMDYKVEIEFYPWQRCLLMMENGEADILICAYYSDERAEYMLYPDPVEEVELVFYQRIEDNISYEKLEDLKDYSIGITRGFVHTPEFDSATFLNKQEVISPCLNISKLLKDRVDLILGEKKAIKHCLTLHHLRQFHEIKQLPKALSKNKLYITINRNIPNSEMLLKKFNIALKDLKSSGEYDKILEKYGF